MQRDLYLAAAATARMRTEIERAGGSEVCFLARVGEDGRIDEVAVVARGSRTAVLAATREGRPGMLVVHNHPSGELTPSEADFQVAAQLHDRGLGLAIVDNAAVDLYVVVEPAAARQLEVLDEAEIEVRLRPGGPLSHAHAGYEDRPMQREMARNVAALFNEGGAALAEAGTGTGKSVAYLLPAVLWSLRNRERVVVSTNTINLQEQLVGKDLPLLKQVAGEAFGFALVKGRGNYVSIRRARLAAATRASLFDDAEDKELDSIMGWLETTGEGSLQDLPFEPTPEVWDEIVSETDVCLRVKCPHFRECFYQRARRDSALADVLVVNHALLFSDLALRRAQNNYTAAAVLPPYRRVILDEAHNLEDAATAHLGSSLSRRGLLRLLGRLDRQGRGVLTGLEHRAATLSDGLLATEIQLLAVRLRPTVDLARKHSVTLFSRLAGRLSATEDGVVRLGAEYGAQSLWLEDVEPVLVELTAVLSGMAVQLDRLAEAIATSREAAELLGEPLVEIQALAARARSANEALQLTLRPETDGFSPLVRWIERRGGTQAQPNVAVCAAPVEIGEALRETLFDRADTVVMTSATLSTADGFGFVRRRLGLDRGVRVHERTYPSPFDYSRQALVAVATDLPDPRREESAFDLATAGAVRDVATLSGGGLFALFTSYRALRAVASELRRSGAAAVWPLFVQGEAPRARLLEHFTTSGRAILLGVASFWEGVDVPGEPLRGLVIAKLPFKVPGEPLTAARMEALEAYGGSGFRDYLLPHAALRLKQGFGRLIRSRTDRGAVVLLDPRVQGRGYGRYFLESLPPAPVEVGTWPELRESMARFYGGEGGAWPPTSG